MPANITLTDELRRKLESMAGPEKTADDLANEAISQYVRSLDIKSRLHALAVEGRSQSQRLGLKASDVNRLISESRRGRPGQ